MRVAVLGSGIVGAAAALELQRDGHEVTIVEPGPPGGEQAASFGNGCWLSPGSVIPMSAPGLWRKVPGYLADPLGPLTMRWSYLPRALPWLIRFLAAGATEGRVLRIAQALRPLVVDCVARHRALAEAAGVGELIRQTGLLYVFPERSDFIAEAMSWRIRAAVGLRWIELDEDTLRQREPALDRRYRFGLVVEEGGHCTDPGAYVAALVRHAEAQGARRVQTAARGFRIAGGRLQAVQTDAGEIAAERAVIAAGAWSRALARAAGDGVPLQTERGYHVSIANPEAAPRLPIMPGDSKAANALTREGLRIAGQVEIAGLEAAPNWQRAEVLLRHALATYPGLPRDIPRERIRLWMGHRPSTPDGLPVIGPARASADIVYCFGHGHIGLAGGPASARLAADLIGGGARILDPAPYAAARFRRLPWQENAAAAARHGTR